LLSYILKLDYYRVLCMLMLHAAHYMAITVCDIKPMFVGLVN